MLFPNIQEAFEWEDYLEANLSIKRTSGEEIRACCFVCGDTKHRLYVNPVKGKWNCFKCGFTSGKFDVFDFVAKLENIPRHRAIARLLQEYKRTTPDDPMFDILAKRKEEEVFALPEKTPIKLAKLPQSAKLIDPVTHKNAYDYLIDRGLTPQEIMAVCAHFVPEKSCPVLDTKGNMRGDVGMRIVFPVYGGDNDLVSWQARTIDPEYTRHDKYLVCPESEIVRTLWPYVPPTGTHAVLTEGILDALAVRRVPGMNSYATFSKKISVDQIYVLKTWGVKTITVFWDRKDAKREIIKAAKELLMHFDKVFVCRMTAWPKNKDAGNMLVDPKGSDILQQALVDCLDVTDSLEYAKWQISWTD